MTRGLAIAITVTDLAFLFYWTVAALSLAGLLHIPADWMYANYDRADVVAWNWSFLPMDLAFSLSGLKAVAASRRADPHWRAYAIVSLTLTWAAGMMAVSYWTLLKEFDPFWFVSNLALVVWPPVFLRDLVAGASGTDA